MAKPVPTTVDEYIAAQPEEVREKLDRVRHAIRKAAPEAEEKISYKIPAYLSGGRPVLYFAAWKTFYSIYPATRTLLAAFEKDLVPYEVRKSTIRFSFASPVPVRLIGRLAKFRTLEEVQKEKKRKT